MYLHQRCAIFLLQLVLVLCLALHGDVLAPAGGGLDIDGWSFLKQEQGRNVNDVVDRGYVHRQQFPLVIRYDNSGNN